MKILIYSANYAPEPTGIGNYSGEMAAWMASVGHDVRVVSAPPYYPGWKVEAPYKAGRYHFETRDGVKVWRAPLWVPAQPGGLTRILHLMTFAISSLPTMLRQIAWRPQVVLTVAPALTCAPGGWLTARMSGAKAWLHIQDYEVDVAMRMGLVRVGWLAKAVLAAERVLFRRFDRVSSISDRMLEQARTKGVDQDRLVFFPNWVDTKAISPLRATSPYRRELNIPEDAVVALYSGSFGGKHGLMMLPAAAERLKHLRNLYFVICGEGVLRPDLEVACADMPNVRLLPLQPKRRLNELLGMADIHLLPQSPGAEDLVMPSKLSGMMASGRPTIATSRPGTEIARVVEGRGLVVPPEDLDAFSTAIETLTANAAIRAEMGARARRYAEQFLSRDAILQRLMVELKASTRPPRDYTETLATSTQ